MDDLNLSSDESVIYKSQKIISSGSGYEAIITDRRFILAESGAGTIREDLPFTAIALAVPEFNSLREPVILLSIASPDGGKRELELIFVHVVGDLNVQDRDRCLATLRARDVTVEGPVHQVIPPSLVRRGTAEDSVGSDGENVRPAVPEWTVYGTPRYIKQAPEEAPPRSPLVPVIAALLVIGLCIGGILIAGHLFGSNPVPGAVTVSGQEAGVTETVTPTQALLPETTAVPTLNLPSAAGAIPSDGVWVRVSYPGNFSGTVGAEGWMTEVNGSGTQLYQLPVHDTTIGGTIEKQDGSGNILDIVLYNGGTPVSESTTAKPWGAVDLDIPVGPALMNGPVTTAATLATPAVAAAATPDTSLLLHEIPATGVWVRVAYPGNFTGTISANGIGQDVNSSGDQFYQLSMATGTIDGFIEKGDGSGENMIVQVYKDGTLVTYDNTSAPLGTVEIHTTV
ncbi:hypothetical protein [Methanoregula sp.]|uniref:hypothetical protein n=1 Tax=Methanoregula sp. TaxID=2052170 RepID=UPI003C78EAD4